MAKLKGKNPKHAKPQRLRMVVFGAAGVGKTWTAIDFPACYYIDTEGGANLPEYTDKLSEVDAAYMGPEDGANDYGVVLDQILALSTEKHDRKTLVIDSHSKLFNTEVQIEHDRLVSEGRKVEFAVEKKPAVSKTRQLITRLDTLDLNAILICHEKTQWKNGEQIGETFDSYEKLGYELNLVVQVLKTGDERIFRVIKSRFAKFAIGTTHPWKYETFREVCGQDALEHDAVPVPASTAEQVATIEKLVGLLKTDIKTTQKWWDAAGVTSWAEMDTVRIGKCIDHLKGQMPSN